MRVHLFEDSGDAYDQTQWNDEIKNGDVLIIPSEKVVGLADTWPFAVTKQHGKLHATMDGPETYCRTRDAERVNGNGRIEGKEPCFLDGYHAAIEAMRLLTLKWEV